MRIIVSEVAAVSIMAVESDDSEVRVAVVSVKVSAITEDHTE